jgi:hypothetical protein
MSPSLNGLHEITDTHQYIEFLELNLTEDNYVEYIYTLQDCANKGDIDCVIRLSRIYKHGDEFTESNITAAIETLKTAFLKYKNAKIASEIAEIYWLWIEDNYEDNDDTNDIEATKWYEIAANLGDAESCETLGNWHTLGLRCEKNIDKAIRYYELAISYGSKSSYHELANLYLTHFTNQAYSDKALQLLLEGSVRGDEVCQYEYFTHLDEGDLIKKDKKEALMWLEKSAHSNYSPAQLKIANKYLSGDFLDKNIYEAFDWLEKAAQNHNQEAQLQLYTCYLIGSGTEKNLTQALTWLIIGLRNQKYQKNHKILEIFTPVYHRMTESLNDHQVKKARKNVSEFLRGNSYRYSDDI